jgi:hypothetical protein
MKVRVVRVGDVGKQVYFFSVNSLYIVTANAVVPDTTHAYDPNVGTAWKYSSIANCKPLMSRPTGGVIAFLRQSLGPAPQMFEIHCVPTPCRQRVRLPP